MASPAWFIAAFSALRPTHRFSRLFAMSDHDLATRGYNREGLTRGFIAGRAGF